VPHSPDGNIQGQIISVYDGVDGAAQYSNVVINRGKREQVEPGDVFNIVKNAKPVTLIMAMERKRSHPAGSEHWQDLHLPRFDKVSYGLVLDSTDAASVGDVVNAPEANEPAERRLAAAGLTPGIGPAGFLKLIAAFGSASHVLAASTAQTAPLVGQEVALALRERRAEADAQAAIAGPNKRMQPAQPAG
jgi:hypothetical protein